MKKISSLVLALCLFVTMTCVAQAGPAPDLTQMGVYQVRSTDAGIEDVYQKFSTQLNHGGDALYVLTYEIGYSSPYSRIAKMNGARLNEIDSQSIDLNNDNIVDGWFRLWDASGHQSGQFTYEASSINNPGHSMSTWINIK
ncbi:DUF4879 domain-containing protein [Vallitalea guaymasensis]|uniref:DUF4879 domain-containing protein n=1 Tax=Vallitalea guaymasensis TaxID=1185412 RepID=UPI002353ABBA|nr:DUF4879 domain-containing protein [Vallitalea guaymasensis]